MNGPSDRQKPSPTAGPAGARPRRFDPTYSWRHIRAAFLTALREGRAVGFCESWLDQLELAREELSSEEHRHDPPHPDLPTLNETVDSLALLLDWWLPSRTSNDVERAAAALRGHIVVALKVHAIVAMEAQRQAEEQQRDVRALGVLVRRISALESNDAFMTAVMLGLADYDPATTEASPDAAMFAAIQSQLDRELGWLIREIRSEAPKQYVLTRRSLGDEIRRRFALPSSDPAYVELDVALGLLTDEERQFLATLYGEGGYKAAQRRWSGRKIDELRRLAIPKLLERLPNLRRFVLQ